MERSLNYTIERVLEAMEELEIKPLFEPNSGYCSFAYFGVDMLLATDFPEGDVCLAAEFVIDFPKCGILIEKLSGIVNETGYGFVVREAFPGLGFVAKTWTINWERPLPWERFRAMLVELYDAWQVIVSNIFRATVAANLEMHFYSQVSLLAEEKPKPVVKAFSANVSPPVSAISSNWDDLVRFSVNLDSFEMRNPIIVIRFACDYDELPPAIVESGFEPYYNASLEKRYPDWEFFRVRPETAAGRSAVLVKACPPLCAAEVAHYSLSENKLYKLLDFYE